MIVDLAVRRERFERLVVEAAYPGAMVATFAPLNHSDAVREARILLEAISPRWRDALTS